MSALTGKSKKLIAVSCVISALLLITAAVWYISAGAAGQKENGGIFIFLAIAAIAVFSTAVLIYGRMKRSGFTRELGTEYYEAYEAVRDSVGNANLTAPEKKEVMSDVTEMLYYAQKEGRSAKDAIGDDIEGFVDKVKASFGYRSGAVFYIINGILYLIMLLSLLQAVNYFAHTETAAFFDAKMGVSIVPYMAALSFLVVPLMRRALSRKKMGWAFIIPVVLIVIYIGINEILYRINTNAGWLDFYLNGETGFITSWWMLAVYVAVAALGFLAKWLLRKRSLKRI